MHVLVERRIPPIPVVLVALTLAMSLTAAIDARLGGTLYEDLALVPEAVWCGQVWRLVTFAFVHGGPLWLLIACAVLYAFGSGLGAAWGERRFARYVAGVVLAAGVGTSVLALVVPGASDLPHLGGMVLIDALVIAWARQFPDSPVRMYFVLVVSGPALVKLVVAATLVFTIFVGVGWMLPELVAVAFALLHVRATPRRLWLRLRLAWVRRNLRVVRGGAAEA